MRKHRESGAFLFVVYKVLQALNYLIQSIYSVFGFGYLFHFLCDFFF